MKEADQAGYKLCRSGLEGFGRIWHDDAARQTVLPPPHRTTDPRTSQPKLANQMSHSYKDERPPRTRPHGASQHQGARISTESSVEGSEATVTRMQGPGLVNSSYLVQCAFIIPLSEPSMKELCTSRAPLGLSQCTKCQKRNQHESDLQV